MNKHHTHPLALAVATLCFCMSAQAQSSNDAATKASGAADGANTPTAPSAPAGDAGFMGGLFSAPGTTGSMSQLAATPSYELTGIGRRDRGSDTSILTAPVNGLPVRFDNGIFVYASALAGFGHNSNVNGVSSGGVSSNLYSLQPDIVGELKTRGDRYTLRYQGNYTKYTASSADNFNHHNFDLAGDNYLSSRSSVGWDVGYIETSDARGTTNTATTSTPNRWNAPTARVLYAYGSKEAQGRIEVEGNYISKRYQNNLSVTSALNQDKTGVAGRFFYRVAPRTSMMVELNQVHADYVNNTGYTNNDRRIYLGVVWDATAKTSGAFKIGSAQKTFSDGGFGKATGTAWEGAVKWSPLTYSNFEFISNRTLADSTGLGNYLINTGNLVNWNHKWRSNLTSTASLGTLKTEYDGAGRTDNVDNASIGVFYEVGRNWRAGAQWAYTKRKSNQANFEFNRNSTFFSLQGTL
ncbi:outer membrane beta-barrel protein [Curvibacter lanceolatus]|uniref:outer membrane beta-barrel protein n=1 Tax=Curvibacter lanceolatus TaxID=86182 RepID=UPI00039D61C9|nr:outer membrane beta-barrel protein [Curvibacter lanceolatus]